MAIDYIKALKEELDYTRAKLKTAELKLSDTVAETPSTESETALVIRHEPEELKGPDATQ